MMFYEVLEQALALLQQHGRVTYRALKRQFALDDDYIEDLKAELIQARRLAVDEQGAVLVLCHFEIIGYSLCSLMRASSVVNCQWALACRSFRSRFHAWTFLISVALAAIRPPRHCRLRWLSSISAMFNQLPCLGV